MLTPDERKAYWYFRRIGHPAAIAFHHAKESLRHKHFLFEKARDMGNANALARWFFDTYTYHDNSREPQS